ncbi:pyridoxamine 5'-phosphate oxidase family protein [Mycobacterium sp. M23085]|uniref:pyridoxamine 5'-phosphate oxidase family protein n=1 Tax=Mycobacterium sp. M23085 TaxID=3378087 RepID=UPI003877FBD9
MANTAARSAGTGFHGGELAVQRRAGVQLQAARLAPMVSRGELRSGVAAFLAETTFAALTARDRTGRLWTSPLLGAPGLLRPASSNTLWIDTTLPDADPLSGLPDGQPVGLIAIDFGTRRRVRVNGFLASVGAGGLMVDVEQAYGNCPQYIQQRRLHIGSPPPDTSRSRLFSGEALRPEDNALVRAADTFFLGTTHPDYGNDASHRGGPAGFVRIAHDYLWWPDYPGNNMFNSFGNLAVDPAAALLFVDFPSSTVLQLSGTASVLWGVPAVGDDAHTGRRVKFIPQQVITTTLHSVSETDHVPYPHNPLLTS